jgi:hypothetical protein
LKQDDVFFKEGYGIVDYNLLLWVTNEIFLKKNSILKKTCFQKGFQTDHLMAKEKEQTMVDKALNRQLGLN